MWIGFWSVTGVCALFCKRVGVQACNYAGVRAGGFCPQSLRVLMCTHMTFSYKSCLRGDFPLLLLFFVRFSLFYVFKQQFRIVLKYAHKNLNPLFKITLIFKIHAF